MEQKAIALHKNLTKKLTGELSGSLLPRNIVVNGRRTSTRLEPATWDALLEICARERCSIHELCTWIEDTKVPQSSLTAAIRVFAMSYFRHAATEDGHKEANHGSLMKPGSKFKSITH